MKLPKRVIDALNKTLDLIRTEAMPVIMDSWFSTRIEDAEKKWKLKREELFGQGSSVKGWVDMSLVYPTAPKSNGKGPKGCGTAACIGGHMYVALGYTDMPEDGVVGNFLEEKLKWDFTELFYIGGWPSVLQSAYHAAEHKNDYTAMREITIAAIQAFLYKEEHDKDKDLRRLRGAQRYW